MERAAEAGRPHEAEQEAGRRALISVPAEGRAPRGNSSFVLKASRIGFDKNSLGSSAAERNIILMP
jgi:hypothetical protein